MRKILTAFAVAASLVVTGAGRRPVAPSARPRRARRERARRSGAAARRVNIPYETFTLPNGLRVIVHEDRKAPVVAVSVWYHVGSKDEPAGQHRLRPSVRASDVRRLREQRRALFHAACSGSARPT